MPTGLDHILIPNALGLTLTLMLLFSNSWRLRQRSRENGALMGLIICTLIACVADPITYLCDGNTAPICFVGNLLGNGYLYMSNMLAGTSWLYFLTSHMHIPMSKPHKRLIGLVNNIGVVLLVANIFVPVAFRISPENLYSRGPGFWIFLVLELLFMADSIWLYTRARRASGFLKRFPVWLFLLPVTIGLLVQVFFFGQSVIWPFVAVSLGSVLSCTQNELILQDNLTGLYNRFYLDSLRTRLMRTRTTRLAAIMLDLNGFKIINDLYGHTEGDHALVLTAGLLTEAVGIGGTVIRYAGDEFIILLPDHGQADMDAVMARLHKAFDDFNASGQYPYRLTAAMGCTRIDLQMHSVDVLLKEIDTRMYEDKTSRKGAMA